MVYLMKQSVVVLKVYGCSVNFKEYETKTSFILSYYDFTFHCLTDV